MLSLVKDKSYILFDLVKQCEKITQISFSSKAYILVDNNVFCEYLTPAILDLNYDGHVEDDGQVVKIDFDDGGKTLQKAFEEDVKRLGWSVEEDTNGQICYIGMLTFYGTFYFEGQGINDLVDKIITVCQNFDTDKEEKRRMSKIPIFFSQDEVKVENIVVSVKNLKNDYDQLLEIVKKYEFILNGSKWFIKK